MNTIIQMEKIRKSLLYINALAPIRLSNITRETSNTITVTKINNPKITT